MQDWKGPIIKHDNTSNLRNFLSACVPTPARHPDLAPILAPGPPPVPLPASAPCHATVSVSFSVTTSNVSAPATAPDPDPASTLTPGYVPATTTISAPP